MTKSEAIGKLIAWLKAQLGYTEGENNSNKYAAIAQPLLGWNAQNQPWCDTFTDAAFIECFGLAAASKMTYQPIGRGSALCRQSAQYFKNNLAWSDKPQIGAVVFFYYSGDINHQGIVVDVSGGMIRTVEGNSSDAVRSSAYPIGYVTIAGYGIPDWSVVAEDASEDPPEESEPKKPDSSYCAYTYNVAVNLLKRGNHGPQVLHMQQLLKANGFDPGALDGQFGDKTVAALKDFQRAAGIGADGEWGGESFKAMWNFGGTA